LTWRIEWDDRARKELRTLDVQHQKRIFSYLNERARCNPRNFGKSLSGNKAGLWRYRVESFRVVCHLQDKQLTVLVVAVAYRKSVYR
jgi:mRNA interferase RelE/StbE